MLRVEKQNLRDENPIIKNSNKADQANNTNKIKELETQVKHLQKRLTEANRKKRRKSQRGK